MSTLISIIVPCYNQAQYLDECMKSVIAQTFDNWECIIVDDGSSDNTKEIAKKWIDKDSRFKYIHQENAGVAAARNKGVENALGEWILPLDGDDKIGNKYLELAENEFQYNPDIIYCEAFFFGEIEGKFELKEFSYPEILKNNIIFCSAFYRKEKWQKTKGYDTFLKAYEDWDFWISLLKTSKEKKVIKLNYEGFYYRRKVSSRDTDILKNESERKKTFNDIFLKHSDEYFKTFGDFFNMIDDVEKLHEENERLLNLINEPILKKIIRKIKKF